jgi:hypothetical protein
MAAHDLASIAGSLASHRESIVAAVDFLLAGIWVKKMERAMGIEPKRKTPPGLKKVV